LKETGVDKGPEQVPYRVAENAMISSRPVRPHKALLLIFALFGGSALGVGIALTRELLDNTVRTVDDAERTFDVRVLAAVPERKGKPGREIEFIENPCSSQADAIRALRTSLSVAAREEAHTCHIVTSAGPVEGKSYVCVNLAAAFASRGLRTLVIDADLRRPQVSDLLCGSENGSPAGLTDYLQNPGSLDEVIYPFAAERLFMLPAGRPASNPGEVLAGAEFRGLVQKLRTKFDRIVIDTAPVATVSDTLGFAALADGICFVIRAGKTPSRLVQTAKDQLRNAGATMSGIVLNRVALRDVHYGDYRYEGRKN
jgi:capsular exopolysaccharide synthesis family protein